MIKVYYASEKTNSYRPTPWHLSSEPFVAYRGNSHTYSPFQAVSSSYKPEWSEGIEPTSESYTSPGLKAFDKSFSRIITTAKGTKLIVPCSKEEDQKILLVTMRGGFRGGFSRIEIVSGEMISKKSGNKHCCPTAHNVCVLGYGGYLFSETGRRCSSGQVEVYSWENYFEMTSEEFEFFQENRDNERK